MLKTPERFERGYALESFPVSEKIRNWVRVSDWESIDREFRILTQPSGALFKFLKTFHEFESIEFILSVRDADDEYQEDGIWHDDGSRLFSFSLSLTTEPVEGGELGVRRVGDASFHAVKTPDFGQMILFLTGHYGFEHKIHRVTKGRRVMVVGWCSVS